MRQTAVPRGDIFLTTKIPCAGNASAALDYVRQDLSQLQLPYADLILIHQPKGCESTAQLQATWQGLEQAVGLGLARAIGVSNFQVEQLQAVEILWTPQDVNDTLTSNEVVADYPRMAPLA